MFVRWSYEVALAMISPRYNDRRAWELLEHLTEGYRL